MANVTPVQLDNQEAQQQLNNARWEGTDSPHPRPWEEAPATAKLFECSRIKALAGRAAFRLGSSCWAGKYALAMGRGTEMGLSEGASPLKWCSQWVFK